MSRSPLTLPPLGFGCSPPRRPVADLAAAAAAALELGYRLFDTAEAYGSEPMLGALLAGDRRGVAVVTKLWQTNHARAHVQEACEGSLRRLRRDALDLYLVHAPEAWAYLGPFDFAGGAREELERRVVPREAGGAIVRAGVPLEETWQAMLELRRRGLARAVGLANVGIAELERLHAAGLEPPAAVQVELHPWQPQGALVERCRQDGIVVMAHSPFGAGRLLADPRLQALAAVAARSTAGLILGWHRVRGVVPVVGACDPAHLRDNLLAIDEPLDAALAASIDRLDATGSPVALP